MTLKLPILLCVLFTGVALADDPLLEQKAAAAKASGHLVSLMDLGRRTGYERIVRVIRNGEAVQLSSGRLYNFTTKEYIETDAELETFTIKARFRRDKFIRYDKGGIVKYVPRDDVAYKKCEAATREIISLIEKEHPRDDRRKFKGGDPFNGSSSAVVLIEYYQLNGGCKHIIVKDSQTVLDVLSKELSAGS